MISMDYSQVNILAVNKVMCEMALSPDEAKVANPASAVQVFWLTF